MFRNKEMQEIENGRKIPHEESELKAQSYLEEDEDEIRTLRGLLEQ